MKARELAPRVRHLLRLVLLPGRLVLQAEVPQPRALQAQLVRDLDDLLLDSGVVLFADRDEQPVIVITAVRDVVLALGAWLLLLLIREAGRRGGVGVIEPVLMMMAVAAAALELRLMMVMVVMVPGPGERSVTAVLLLLGLVCWSLGGFSSFSRSFRGGGGSLWFVRAELLLI